MIDIEERKAFAKKHPRLFKRYAAEKEALEKKNQELLSQILRGDKSVEPEYKTHFARIADLELMMRGRK